MTTKITFPEENFRVHPFTVDSIDVYKLGWAQNPPWDRPIIPSGKRPRVPIEVAKTLYVANAGTNNVTVYAPGTDTPLRTNNTGVISPSCITFDAIGNLYVVGTADSASSTVPVYAPGSTTPLRTISEGINAPQQVAIAPSNDVYVLNSTNVTVYKSETTQLLQTIVDGIVMPSALGFDETGNLYVANNALPAQVTVYSAGNNQLLRTIAIGDDGTLYVITLDAAGNLYVGEGPSITVYAAGSTEVLRTINEGAWVVLALAIDHYGNLYAALDVGDGHNGVAVYGASSSTLLYTISHALGNPTSSRIRFLRKPLRRQCGPLYSHRIRA